MARGVWMLVGVVKWYDCRKGYGFIVTSEGDVLAHYSVIEGTGFRRLWEGEEVEYRAVQGPKGLNASYVRRLNPNRPAGKGAEGNGGGGGIEESRK